jgi:hypothetical protein
MYAGQPALRVGEHPVVNNAHNAHNAPGETVTDAGVGG